MDAELRAAQVMLDDRLQRRQRPNECATIVGHVDVAMQRVEEPERRIGRVIESLIAPVGEHVRDQAVANVMLERPEDESGLTMTARYERQPFEADHRVASPIGEPVIASDDRADLVAGRGGSRRIDDASRWCEDELIGREHELGGDFVRRLGMRRDRRVEQSTPPLLLARATPRSADSADITCSDSADATRVTGSLGSELDLEMTRRPERSAKLVAPLPPRRDRGTRSSRALRARMTRLRRRCAYAVAAAVGSPDVEDVIARRTATANSASRSCLFTGASYERKCSAGCSSS